jgi:hypothetical protein
MDADLIKDFDFSESEVEISLNSAEGHRKKGEFDKAQGDIESAKAFILRLNEAEAHFQKNKKEGEIVITGTSPTGTVRFYEPRHEALWNRSVALEAQVACEWHSLDDRKQKFLEQRLQLVQQLQTEKNPAKQSDIRKEIGKIDKEVNWLNQGILELGTFDQNIRVPSLAHTNHRERTRAKFLEGYLNHDEKKVEEARGEMFVLWKVQELETVQGKFFPSFIGQYPSHFSYPGLLDYSDTSVTDAEVKLQRGFQKMYWEKGKGKIYLNKPDSFEPEPKLLNEGKNIGEKDEVKPLSILTEHRRHSEQDAELGKSEERGGRWMMMGDTAVLHAGRVRATSFPGSEKPQNKFSRTDVNDSTSYDQILLTTESGLKDVGAVQALVNGLDQTEGERNVGHGWYALGSTGWGDSPPSQGRKENQ